MEYSITRLARLAGVSTRTLRYYDQIGLLSPSGSTPSGMRTYGSPEVDRLQEILFFRELDVPLGEIARNLASPGHDRLFVLEGHRRALLAKRDRVGELLETVESAIRSEREGISMEDEMKFKALKEKDLAKNEAAYGKEVRERYGEAAAEAANARYANLSRADYDRAARLANDITAALLVAMDTNDPGSEASRILVGLHKEWLTIFWGSYSPEAHKGLADMYVADKRFRSYYDKNRAGAAEFLRDAIRVHAK